MTTDDYTTIRISRVAYAELEAIRKEEHRGVGAQAEVLIHDAYLKVGFSPAEEPTE